MRARALRFTSSLPAVALLCACADDGPASFVGTLEWDRIAVTAELAEPVLEWVVAEGERVEAGAAILTRARAAQTDAEAEYDRAAELRKRELVAASVTDHALAVRNQRRAETAHAEAQLRELTQGTRPEQIEQAAAAVEVARADRIDALPFRVGDQPPLGAELVSLLVGDTPYARVFVPAPRRAELVLEGGTGLPAGLPVTAELE